MRVSVVNVVLLTLTGLQILKADPVHGQTTENTFVRVEAEHESLGSVFQKIEDQTDFTFVFPPELVENYNDVTIASEERSVQQTLEMVMDGTPLNYKETGATIVIYFKEEEASDIEASIPRVQYIGVRGIVRDDNGSPMPGVSVIVKGTTNGTTTEVDGTYSLTVASEADVLVFSSIGYKIFELTVGTRSSIDVVMNEDVTALTAVVIKAGYYDVKDKEKTGSIARVSAEEIQRAPVTNPLQAMQGRTPGVYINQESGVPGSNFQVRIRGTNSIKNGNNPLYLIDGVPFSSETLSDVTLTSTLYGNGSSPLNSLNPNDIESIEILKDADATAIYGSRGANGVVLITTKKGKSGKVKFDINLKTGISKSFFRARLLNTEQYLRMRLQAVANDGDSAPRPEEYDINGVWDQNRYTDWQKVLVGGTAPMTTINTSISGGSKETQFLFSGGFDKQGTVFPGDNTAQRVSSLFSITHTSTDGKFDANFSTSYSRGKTDLLSRDLAAAVLRLPPNAPRLYNDDGSLNWENSTWGNPLANLLSRFNANTSSLITNVELGFELVKGLHLKGKIGANSMRSDENRTDPSSMYEPSKDRTPASSLLIMGRTNLNSWILEPQVNWQKSLDRGKISMLVGGSYQSQTKENSSDQYTGFSSNALINDPNSAAIHSLQGYNYSEYRYAAVYGRFNFIWNDKYILNVTGRRDGSSRFGPGNHFANLGAAGVAWVFSNEAFFKTHAPFVSFGKIRGSIGVTGNDQIGDYQYLDSYKANRDSYQDVGGLVPAQLFNPNYGWEKNKKIEGALEVGFANDRVTLTLGYYRNRSSNQLIDYQLASTTGFSSVIKNSPAIVQNTGVEFDVTTINVDNSSFKWTTSFNVTIPDNKLVAFPNLESSSYNRTYSIGKSITMAKRYHYLGVDSDTGLYQFADVNSDGMINLDDKMTPLEAGQKYYGGLNNGFTFSGFHLDVFVQFVRQTRNSYVIYAPRPGAVGANQEISVLTGVWEKPGDIATRQFYSRKNLAIISLYDIYQESDANFFDSSFIRLKNVSVSYQIPDNFLKGMTGRIYLQGQNLLTFSKYKGVDPEGGASSIAPLTTLLVGVQVTL